jgi:hypothetical protein
MSHRSRGWEFRRQDENLAVNADQAEFFAIMYGSSNFESGTYDERLAGAMDDYEVVPPTPTTRWANDDAALDSATSEIGFEINRRKAILADKYPFIIKGNKILYTPSKSLVYEFCLAISLAASLSAGETKKLPIAFERLARDLMIYFLGPGAEGHRTGWPADSHEPRPAKFKTLMAGLSNLTGEWTWSPEPGLPNDPPCRDVKDEGLDFVVWKGFVDKRAGKLFVLGQCACGSDYLTKFSDIDPDLKKLKKWLRPLSHAAPIRVFTTPRHIPNDIYFREVNELAGLTLDRIRITLIAEESDLSREYVLTKAKIPYQELIQIVISGFQVAPPKKKQQPRKAAAVRRSR